MNIKDIKTSPYDHQKESMKFHLKRKYSADFSEQGTGKTLTALLVAAYRLEKGEIKKVLIACPACVQHVWANEIEKHTDFDYVILEGPKRFEKAKKSKAPFHIISYDGSWRQRKKRKK